VPGSAAASCEVEARCIRVRKPRSGRSSSLRHGGDTVTYAELELRSNRLAHFLRASGLRRLDHYAIWPADQTP